MQNNFLTRPWRKYSGRSVYARITQKLQHTSWPTVPAMCKHVVCHTMTGGAKLLLHHLKHYIVNGWGIIPKIVLNIMLGNLLYFTWLPYVLTDGKMRQYEAGKLLQLCSNNYLSGSWWRGKSNFILEMYTNNNHRNDSVHHFMTFTKRVMCRMLK